MREKTITEFLSEEYKEFAFYTIESRAIASLIDGFKPVQRKIIHASSQIWKTGSEKSIKVFQLGGKVSSEVFYHHGDLSMNNAIINLAQKFKNNVPLLEEDGQFGSLRSPQAGAPRYIGTKLSKYFRLIYKDFELLDYKEEEGEKIEPHFFLPIIPTILVNGSSGIAVGFASNILTRNIKDIIESCQKLLKGKKISTIVPYLNVFNGTYIQDKENKKRWIIRGTFQKVNTTTIRITELPPSMTYEKFEKILDKLVEDKEIVSYEDNCKDSIDYVVKMTRSSLEKLEDETIIKLFKLEEYETENFTTLDECGKLKIFESDVDIIEYFVDFRLKFYGIRKDYIINKLNRELVILNNRSRFIQLILDGKIEINNVKKDLIVLKLEELNFDKVDGDFDYLLRMPIHSLTKDTFEKMKSEIGDKIAEIDVISKKDITEMYLEDLSELKNKLKF